MAKSLINTFLILIFILFFPFISFSQEIYEYERMWPVLEQPWYFDWPISVAVDTSGNVYVADTDNHRIQKFTSNCQFIAKWGSYGSGDGKFSGPFGIALDTSGNVYVADSGNHRIQKFTSNGQFIAKWGSQGSGDGQFVCPSGIALDTSGNVYVADRYNYRIQKFTSKGQFITKWGSQGSGDGQFDWPSGIALDTSGNVYVADQYNHRIQKFTSNGQFITKWGNHGSNPGEFSYPDDIVISSEGKFYVSDAGNNRIQVFSQVTKPFNNRAIIVAGGGPYLDEGGTRVKNNLWPATQVNANFAYRTLTYQGFSNNTIYYLSWDININLDLNNDGIPDVDAEPTNDNLQYALTEWAKDADNVVIYLVGHGGNGTFRINETDLLKAEDLHQWLDILQQTMQGTVAIIYDACYSGSILSKLAPPGGKQRIIISGSAEDEVAWFMNDGMVSFSYLFWSRTFYGDRVFKAFSGTQKSMGDPQRGIRNQNPQLDDNGNGKGNEEGDGAFSTNYSLGKGIVPPDKQTEMFSIVSASSDQTLKGETSATITVDSIENLNSVTKVWAIVIPPDFTGSSGDPVTDLPTFDLTWDEQNKRYEGTYDGFTVVGTYTVMVYAMNEQIAVSLPKAILITQTMGESLSNRCDFNGDGKTDILWRNKITGQNVVWYMNGATYSDYAELQQVTDTDWRIVGTGDFNGDGKTDILWRNKSTGQNVVWLMNGTAYNSYAELMWVADTNWEIVGTGDFSGDGKTDILWRNKSTGQNVVWFMNGATYNSYAELMQVIDTNWEIVGTGDFNSDGKVDILWRNKTTGQNVVWYMNGANYSNYAEIMQVTDTNWQIVGTGDFNGDGKTDILWRNKTTGQNVVWFMNGPTYSSYADLLQVPDPNWEIVGPK